MGLLTKDEYIASLLHEFESEKNEAVKLIDLAAMFAKEGKLQDAKELLIEANKSIEKAFAAHKEIISEQTSNLF